MTVIMDVLCHMSNLNIWDVLYVSDKTEIIDEWIRQPITSSQKFNQSAPDPSPSQKCRIYANIMDLWDYIYVLFCVLMVILYLPCQQCCIHGLNGLNEAKSWLRPECSENKTRLRHWVVENRSKPKPRKSETESRSNQYESHTAWHTNANVEHANHRQSPNQRSSKIWNNLISSKNTYR